MMNMDNGSEINLIGKEIPKLLISDFKKQNYDDELYNSIVDDINGVEDSLVSAENKYGKLILDIFKDKLDVDDPRLELFSNDYFRLCQEEKYLRFIEKVFDMNDGKVYLDFAYFSDNSKLIQFLENKICKLDKIDSYILLNQINILKKNKSHMYFIDDLNILNLFIKGFLREILWCSLYFPKYPMIVSAGYDLGLPVIVKYEKDKNNYTNMAIESGLYLKEVKHIRD